MINGTMFSLALDIVSMIVILIFVWKLFSSSRELSQLKNIDGSEIIFRSVIAAILVVIAGVVVEMFYEESELLYYVDSVVGLISSFILLYGAIGFSKIIKHLKLED